MMGRVTKCVTDREGNPRGIQKTTLFADNSLYEVSFTNGRTEELTANVISEIMLTQVDSEGHHYQVIKDISDHSADGNALNKRDGFIRSRGGNLHVKKTSRG